MRCCKKVKCLGLGSCTQENVHSWRDKKKRQRRNKTLVCLAVHKWYCHKNISKTSKAYEYSNTCSGEMKSGVAGLLPYCRTNYKRISRTSLGFPFCEGVRYLERREHEVGSRTTTVSKSGCRALWKLSKRLLFPPTGCSNGFPGQDTPIPKSRYTRYDVLY